MADAPETFTCPECGALYEVTRTTFPEPVEDCAECVECGCLMAEWNTSSLLLYRLSERRTGGCLPRSRLSDRPHDLAREAVRAYREVCSNRRRLRRRS